MGAETANFFLLLQVDPNTGVAMYESDDIIKYLVGKYGVCSHIDLHSIGAFQIFNFFFIAWLSVYSILTRGPYIRSILHNIWRSLFYTKNQRIPSFRSSEKFWLDILSWSRWAFSIHAWLGTTTTYFWFLLLWKLLFSLNERLSITIIYLSISYALIILAVYNK